jgi:peroxiredoxin/mono/diheme cytochrome c family protein
MSLGVRPQGTGIGANDRGCRTRRRLGLRFSRADVLATIVVLSALATGGGATAAEKTAAQESTLRTLTDFTLADIHSQKWSLADVKDKKVVVVAFIGTECPLAKLYGPRLALLASQYQDKSVAFLAIDSNVQDSLAALTAYARNAGITFPVVRDAKNSVAAQFGATRTPEVFVLDEARVVRYQGRIDDQYGVGFARKTPEHSELKEAVDSLLAKRSVVVARTQSVGCLIGRAHEPQANAEVTYANQIARLFNKRCVECHHAGDIAPFSLTRYEDAAAWAEMIAEVVDQGRMPPWHADPKYGHFSDDRRLSDDEKRLIHAWVAAGAPQGDLKELPPTPTFAASGWQQKRPPDLILPMSDKPYHVKADGVLSYQNFRVDPHFTEDKWIEAAEILPGNRAVVHHVLVHARGRGERRGGGDGGGGGGGGGAGQGFLAAYVPGLRAIPYPKGMAKRISAGSKLTFQIHYTPNGSKQDDITRIGLWFVDPKSVTQEVRTIAAVNPLFAIPAGADNHPVEASTQSLPSDAQILAFMPHMHVRGKSFLYEAVYADGKRQTLLDVPKYDFNWQTAYRVEQPLKFPKGTKIHAVAHFDNSTDNLNNPNPRRIVFWGDQTYEEMMIGYFDMVTPRGSRSSGDRGRGGFGGFGRLDDEALKNLVKQLDVNKDGKITRDEVPERLQGQFDLIRGGKDSVTVEQLQKMLSGFRRRGAD